MERIQIIEDDQAVQRALRRTFESAGFEISIASDGGCCHGDVSQLRPPAGDP